MNLFKIADDLYNCLNKNGINFSENGYPIIPPEMIVDKVPEEMIPFEHRNECKDKKTTILTHFSNDELLYRRLRAINKDIEICKEYMGVVGFDLSPRLGWNIEQQKFNLLLNQMINAYRAINGIKILPNFRIGELSTIDVLNSYPAKSIFAVGSLGCSKGYKEINSTYLKAKILFARPKMLLIYGKLLDEYKDIIEQYEILYKVYEDFKQQCFDKRRVV